MRQIVQIVTNLTHLNIEVWDLTVIQFISNIAPQLKRLRYLGRLAVDSLAVHSIRETLETLRPLGRTLQALKLYSLFWIDPSLMQDILGDLESALPNLRAVLFDGYEHVVRFKADSWVQASDSTGELILNGWQTLNGDLERLILSRA
ncbi:hypothetical protein PIIN_08174 [Serendipita indica DSM 11827]|uniref:Uncharacterized protein n=1 Tax=Serendipita indica (strain DSM 11827) TaxID=1109443 RepID=G4TSC8_SERID|nr:hypothetical protein PIIN_08174 [Serendipita indica DSM 11827]